jgi:3-deoxy-manno-octulosonate cytidylyltransferase (CMP-KDO synthetase)
MSASLGYIVVIPARYDSARLPGKPLADIHGRPMIAWVYRQACLSSAVETIVATDDERIVTACESFGARVLLTDRRHESGTDRIAEIAARLGWDDDQIVINVQGDEPLIPPAVIDQVAALAAAHPTAAVATLITAITNRAEQQDPNVVKVVSDKHGQALYFSRAAIPSPREASSAFGFRHIGIYAYRVGALREIAAAEPCELERIERLEQLRVLWLGLKIVVAVAEKSPPRGVDTVDDLKAARTLLKQRC